MTVETQLHTGWAFIAFEYKWDELTRVKISTQCPKALSLFQRTKLHPQKVPRPKQHRAAELSGKCSRWVRKVGPLGRDGFTYGFDCTAATCAITTWLWIATENKWIDWAHNLELSGDGEMGALHLFTSPLWKRKKPSPLPQAVPENFSGPFPADLQQDDRPPEAPWMLTALSPPPAELMAQALLARVQSNKCPRDAAESVRFLHASCTL